MLNKGGLNFEQVWLGLNVFLFHVKSSTLLCYTARILMYKGDKLLTIPLCHGFNKLAPLSWHLWESSHSKLVERAAVKCCHIFGGLVSIIRVQPRVRASLAHRLVLDDIFNDASIWVLRGKPLHLDGWQGQGHGLDVAWGWRTWGMQKHWGF